MNLCFSRLGVIIMISVVFAAFGAVNVSGENRAPVYSGMSLAELLPEMVKSTGQLEVFVVSPEKLQQAMRTLSILAAERVKNQPSKEKKGEGKEEKDTQDIQEKILEVLGILSNNRVANGTGWLWDEKQGLVITNNHVIKGEGYYYQITFGNGTKAELELVGRDEPTDVALLRVTRRGGPLPSDLMLWPECVSRVGEEAVSIGYPNRPNQSVDGIPPWTATYGRMVPSTLRESAFVDSYQVDSQFIPGFSGGPTLTLSCGVVGMNVMWRPSRLVPSPTIARVVNDILQHGMVVRGALGVTIVSLVEAAEQGWFIREGVDPRDFPEQGILVRGTIAGYSAAAAGLKSGDVILAVNGESVERVEVFQKKIAESPPGSTLILTVQREHQIKDIPVKLMVRQKNFGKK